MVTSVLLAYFLIIDMNVDPEGEDIPFSDEEISLHCH